MKISINITSPPTSNVPPEGRGRLVWVLHDQFSAHWNYTTRYISGTNEGTPATCKAADSGSEHMNEDYQWFWYNWLQRLAPGRTDALGKASWRNLTDGAKAYTNKTGTDTLRDYVSNTNAGKEDARQENIVPTGSPLICVPGKVKYFAGEPALAVLALDRSYPMPSVDVMINNPLWVCFVGAATVITRTKVNTPVFPSTVPPTLPSGWLGNRKVDPFPNNAAYPTQMTPVPFATWQGEQVEFMGWKCRIKYIRQNRLITLPDAEFPISPFVKP